MSVLAERSSVRDVHGLTARGPLGPGGMPTYAVVPGDLVEVMRALVARGFDRLSLLTAMEPLPEALEAAGAESEAAHTARSDGAEGAAADGEGEAGLDLVYSIVRSEDANHIAIFCRLPENRLKAPSLATVWAGAAPLEREVYDLFGVSFEGHPDLKRIVLRDDFEGFPLRKSFPMGDHGVAAEQVAAATASHGGAPAPARSHSPLAEGSLPGDPVLRSERMVLNMGPQHPSMHGVLHLWLALEGENVVASEPTHGYLHRCIEKLCETRPYRAVTPLLDRCDYVSGFHQELAYMLALEELLGIEPTPKADYLRVVFSELVRITSHHTWFAAAGLDTGALTPFLFAFIDREKILDFFERATGARMMFNYFRPGGVKDDLPEGFAADLKAYLRTFDKAMDDCEALLTGNEIFRLRTRGVGVLPRETAKTYLTSGPMARASGVDVDLRRDEPYAAYDHIPVNVAIAESGDTFDRYAVRVAEMRESARIALAALEGLPEGPHVAQGVPRTIKPPPGAAYRRVESSRGELGVLVVSDGTDKPWRLKVRSPAFSNLHCAPALLEGSRIGDVVAILGSVDVVMGEIDR